MGVPPAHRKVWRESFSSSQAPGGGSRVWSEAPMQRSIRSREPTQGCPTPHFVELTAFCGQHPRAVFATRGLDRILCSRIRNQLTTSGFRFNDSTGDGQLPLEWAQDRVSQDPRGSLCNNLPSLVGKAWGQCRDCYGATDEGLKERTKPVRSILSF